MPDLDLKRSVQIIKDAGFISKKDAKKIYCALVKEMYDTILRGDAVCFDSVCRLGSITWAERKAYDPNSGNKIVVPPRRHFQTIVSRKLKRAMQKMDGIKLYKPEFKKEEKL